jgi:iron complex outermembrane recepter protein
LQPVVLQPVTISLQGVTVIAKKPFIQQLPGKTVVNVDAAITNAGTTAMEVLEKSPGVTVDKDGNISLRGRTGILIMIDNKPSYVSGADLVNLLNGMSSSQIETIELITNPSAQYDAAGNAGIINIKTKKNRQRGFNGTINSSFGHGRYYKTNHSLQLNYRNGKFNYFLNYSMNANKGFSDMYALRKYYKEDRQTIESMLEQPSDMRGQGYNHTIRTGVDYFAGKKTTIGIVMNGMLFSRNNSVNNTASWINGNGVTDSVIETHSIGRSKWKNAGINLNMRHSFTASQELSADIDYLTYDIHGYQAFQNNLTGPNGYEEAFKGDLPSQINIFSAKTDYAVQLPKQLKLESGWKSSHINTDNIADYFYKDGNDWKEDLGKTNHFLYTENIHAAYSNLEKKTNRWTLQAGLRYELTRYKANQLGNSQQKDSAFSRNYNSLFPSASVNFEADSSNQLMISIGRRIDRPAFQKLNPFLFIINKYTYQRGNSLIRPQYTWNYELSHVFKSILTTTLGYSITKDYFSQLFLSNPDGTVIYTEGNFSRMRNISAQVSAVVSPLSWWSFNAQATFNHKRIEGLLWREYVASIAQGNFSMNNQFKFKKNWSAELSGFYITKNQNDIQEVLEPTGQVSIGVAKQVLKSKGTLRLAFRDIFYTQVMEGLTDFQQADEYFKLKRDTRVVTIGFSYRFGKSFKSPVKRSTGGAGDEIERVGTGN